MNEYTQKKIIGWTLGLVIALGAIESKLFLRPPSTVLKAMAMAQKSRLPAGASNVPSSNHAILEVADEVLNFKINCKRKIFQIDAGDARQLRIHYEACANDDDYRISSIVNETNSYQATIFELNHEKQTSDFIALKEGPNRLKIVLANSEHQTSQQEYIFTRTIAKTPAH